MTITRTKSQKALLDRVEAAHAAVCAVESKAQELTETRLVPAITKANDAGVSLREIGEVLGVSHVTVMRMLGR